MNQPVTPARTTTAQSVCYQHRREWHGACTCRRDGCEQCQIRQSWDGSPGRRPDPDLYAGVGGVAVGGEGVAASECRGGTKRFGQSTGKCFATPA